MSISSNNKKGGGRRKPSVAWNVGTGVFLIGSMLLAGIGFAFIGSAKAPMISAYAQEGKNNNNTATSTASNASATTTNIPLGIKLSAQPVLHERTTTVSQTPINQTHVSAAFAGDGTLTLPNTTETIIFNTNGSALISLTTHTTQAKETIMTEDGETATATFYEILKLNPAAADEGRGLTVALFHTNSTGTLAPLNGMIVAGTTDFQSIEENTVRLWEWESGIGNNAGAALSMQ